jgi:hypothetical protein
MRAAAQADLKRVTGLGSRTPNDAWHELPPELHAYLVERKLLSHTFCTDRLHERGLIQRSSRSGT